MWWYVIVRVRRWRENVPVYLAISAAAAMSGTIAILRGSVIRSLRQEGSFITLSVESVNNIVGRLILSAFAISVVECAIFLGRAYRNRVVEYRMLTKLMTTGRQVCAIAVAESMLDVGFGAALGISCVVATTKVMSQIFGLHEVAFHDLVWTVVVGIGSASCGVLPVLLGALYQFSGRRLVDG
jgi:hypothetical protein